MFDVQRAAIEGSQQLAERSFATRGTASRIALTGVKSQESLQRQQLELAQAMAHGTIGTMTAMVPGGNREPIQEGINEGFDQLKTTHAEFYDALERELERDAESVDELSAEFTDAMETSTERLLESSRELEDRTVENVDELASQLRDQLERTRELQDELETQLEHRTEDVEELLETQADQIDAIQEQLEERTEQARDAGGTSIPIDSDRALEGIDGIGTTTSKRLSEAGITTADDLTDTDPETVAEAAEVSTSQAREWIDQAEA
ncbi:helix-hairpin-helix domain-containing protein [Natronococcus sp. A-GB1]|uniref:helix-hairpin-helix domain-containing protein n=1 Tax=Natronococcus sp. A-GB1 TaxID=3037648 RepID=UPI00241CCC82|nr:helix-hairpin-helix domain-containing protein [Natronococcus sp. A-GB1]MDG5761023.1 helix-hairpin-helix domain-containing protein [Natronococcus sp. A-GB1]